MLRNCRAYSGKSRATRIKTGHRHLATIALLFVMLTSGFVSAATPIIKQEELLKKLELESAPLILDVRSPGEYQSGHVPQAINIPYNQLASRLGELSVAQDRQIVTYCERGPRAGIAEIILGHAGFTAVRHLEGDMYLWRQNGLPIERP